MEVPVVAQAPIQLVRFPSLLAALVATAALLAAAGASSPLFLSSAADRAVAIDLAANRGLPALSVTTFGSATEAFVDPRTAALERAVARLPGLGPVDVSMSGISVDASSPAGGAAAQVVGRSGFRTHVHAVTGPSGSGLWVPESLAGALSLRPGSVLTLGAGGGDVTVRVAGVYRDLADPLPDFWHPVGQALSGSSPDHPAPPAILGDPGDVIQALRPLGTTARFDWGVPLTAAALSLQQAERLARGLATVTANLGRPNVEPGSDFQGGGGSTAPYSSTPLPGLVRGAIAVERAVRDTSGTVALAGVGIALLGMAAAGAYGVRRRRVEAALLTARGLSPTAQGVRAVVEAALPAALGGAAGWLLALGLVRLLGPSAVVDPAARQEAVWSAVRALAGGVLLYGVGAGLAARRELEEGPSRRGRRLARAPWEAIVLVLAAASLYEILTRPAGTPASAPDRLLLVFPILFVAGMAGIAVRLLPRALARARNLAPAARPGAYLALRRLASAPRVALLLVAASSAAMGVLAYAGVLSATIARTSEEKATVLVGADVAVPLGSTAAGSAPGRAPAGAPASSTLVLRLPPGRLVPGDPVDLLAVDPRTFAAGARWDGHFAGTPLEELLGSLSGPSRGRVPVLLAGGSSPTAVALRVRGVSVALTVVARTAAFPGMTTSERPMVVAARSTFLAADPLLRDLLASPELWVRGDAGAVVARLRAAGLPTDGAVTAAAVRSQPSLLALSWTFGFLLALGLAAAVVVAVGLVLYLQSLQTARDLAFALGRRMGLSDRTHQRAVTIELGAMLGVAFALGTGLAIAAAAIVRGKLDLLPDAPGPTVLSIPWALLGAIAAGAALTAVVGGVLAQRRTRRTNVSEVLRGVA